jgi:hypothetical protein
MLKLRSTNSSFPIDLSDLRNLCSRFGDVVEVRKTESPDLAIVEFASRRETDLAWHSLRSGIPGAYVAFEFAKPNVETSFFPPEIGVFDVTVGVLDLIPGVMGEDLVDDPSLSGASFPPHTASSSHGYGFDENQGWNDSVAGVKRPGYFDTENSNKRPHL